MAKADSRPQFRNINAFKDLTGYRLPWAGRASIVHRVTGALMFLLLPFAVWLFDLSVSSQVSYDRLSAAFQVGVGFIPAWFLKLVAFALLAGYLFHFFIGLRHIRMDVSHSVSKQQGQSSALIALGLSLLLSLALGAKLFGLF